MGNKKIKCVIVSGAPDQDYDFLKNRLHEGAYIIAADSGYLKCIKAGFVPDLIIGDFDSSEYPEMDTEIIRLPAEKDFTDTFTCVKKAVDMGFSEIELLCAIGNRADHNYANMLCLDYCRKHNVKCVISNRHNRIQLVKNEITINGSEYKYFSVYAFLGTVEGLTIKDAYYAVNHIALQPSDQFAQSNCFKNNMPVKISVQSGIILLIQSND